MLDYLWMGELPDWISVDDMANEVGLTHPGHRCLLGHMASGLLCQPHAWPSDRAHT